jgi:hypothetical protein
LEGGSVSTRWEMLPEVSRQAALHQLGVLMGRVLSGRAAGPAGRVRGRHDGGEDDAVTAG